MPVSIGDSLTTTDAVQMANTSAQAVRNETESNILDQIKQTEDLVAWELKHQPLVTVVIPTYNRAHIVIRALNTVLSQTYQNMEILVVDDGSTDNTAEVLAPYLDRIRYIYQTNQGASSARNRAIIEARGKYVAFLDSDDEWLPTKLECQIKLMESNPELKFVACLSASDRKNYKEFNEPGSQFLKFLHDPFTSNVTRYVVLRECFEKYGVFDTSLSGPEDWEMWLRLLANGCRFGFSVEHLMVYTYSPDAISGRPLAMLAGEQVIRQRYIDTIPNLVHRWSLGSWFAARSYMKVAFIYREKGEPGKCIGYLLRSILANPFGPRSKDRFAALVVTVGQLLKQKLTGTKTPTEF